jgi:hypothetical protein
VFRVANWSDEGELTLGSYWCFLFCAVVVGVYSGGLPRTWIEHHLNMEKKS